MNGIANGIRNVVGNVVDALRGIADKTAETLCIPVYVGGALLDEVVVNAQARQNVRSGGR